MGPSLPNPRFFGLTAPNLKRSAFLLFGGPGGNTGLVGPVLEGEPGEPRPLGEPKVPDSPPLEGEFGEPDGLGEPLPDGEPLLEGEPEPFGKLINLADFVELVENADLGDTSFGDVFDVELDGDFGENLVLVIFPLGDLKLDGDLGEKRFRNDETNLPLDLVTSDADCIFDVAPVIVTVPGSTIVLSKSISLCLALYFSAISFNLKASFIFPSCI